MPPVLDTILQIAAAAGAVGVGSWIISARKVRSDIRKTNSDADMSTALAASEVVDTALKLLDPYKIQLAGQEESIKRLHGRVDVLWAHVGALETFITTAGLVPPARPWTTFPSLPGGE